VCEDFLRRGTMAGIQISEKYNLLSGCDQRANPIDNKRGRFKPI
jgi:hypothetical protein